MPRIIPTETADRDIDRLMARVDAQIAVIETLIDTLESAGYVAPIAHLSSSLVDLSMRAWMGVPAEEVERWQRQHGEDS